MGNRQNATNSLLFCLDELRKLEDDRIASESRARAERERTEADRLARAAAEDEHRRRVAEEEARLRVAAEIASRDADAELRLAALRTELTAVQTEREVLRARFVDVATELPGVAADDRRRAARGWGIAFGAASAVAAGLAVLLVMQDPAPVVVPASAPSAPIAVAHQLPAEPPAAPMADVAAPAEGTPAQAQTETAPPPRVRPTIRRDRDRDTVPRDETFLGNLDECGDDPTCGLEDDERPRRRPR